jgi:hypothetical protein
MSVIKGRAGVYFLTEFELYDTENIVIFCTCYNALHTI